MAYNNIITDGDVNSTTQRTTVVHLIVIDLFTELVKMTIPVKFISAESLAK